MVRKHIEALPAADRDWTLLYLSDEDGSDALATEPELIAAARRRGADVLLSVLKEKAPTNDPDLRGGLGHLMSWILVRAPQLLRPEMADDLLACERSQRDNQKHHDPRPVITPAWPIAAAQLQPERGREILSAALLRFDGDYDRVSLMAALAVVGDVRDYGVISDWFFTPYKVSDGSQGKEAAFLDRLPHQGATQATRQLVVRLIKDQRFDTSTFHATESTAELVNAWSHSPLIDIQKLYEEGWAGGETNPTALAAIARARDRLRQTSAEWVR